MSSLLYVSISKNPPFSTWTCWLTRKDLFFLLCLLESQQEGAWKLPLNRLTLYRIEIHIKRRRCFCRSRPASFCPNVSLFFKCLLYLKRFLLLTEKRRNILLLLYCTIKIAQVHLCEANELAKKENEWMNKQTWSATSTSGPWFLFLSLSLFISVVMLFLFANILNLDCCLCFFVCYFYALVIINIIIIIVIIIIMLRIITTLDKFIRLVIAVVTYWLLML